MKAFSYYFFFFNDTATTEIYTLSLHDALPICIYTGKASPSEGNLIEDCEVNLPNITWVSAIWFAGDRSEEHTSELQSRRDLVCRLLLEKKKQKTNNETFKCRATYSQLPKQLTT